MEVFLIYAVGFASGWAVRSTVDSSRGLVVKALAAAYGVADRIGRAAGMEKEHLEDLLAEARAMYEADRERETRAPLEAKDAAPESSPVISVRGRAA